MLLFGSVWMALLGFVRTLFFFAKLYRQYFFHFDFEGTYKCTFTVLNDAYGNNNKYRYNDYTNRIHNITSFLQINAKKEGG
jgi:hypothetical protein